MLAKARVACDADDWPVRIVTVADDACSFRIRIIRILNLNGDAGPKCGNQRFIMKTENPA